MDQIVLFEDFQGIVNLLHDLLILLTCQIDKILPI